MWIGKWANVRQAAIVFYGHERGEQGVGLVSTTDSALKLLHKLGVHRIVLDKLDEWQPEQAALQKRSRPDRAQALTRTAEYDRWVNTKVQSSRAAKLAQRQALQAK